MQEIITLAIRLALAIMCGIIVPAFKKWLDSKTENEKIQQIKQVAETAVYAAEQMFSANDPDGSERLKYAEIAIRLAAGKAGIALTGTEINAYIEAAVQEINLYKHGAVVIGEEDEDAEMDS